MAKVVVARFALPQQAEVAARRVLLTAGPPDIRGAIVHRERIDPLDLPDEATEVGRNIWMATIIGALSGLIGMAVLLTFVHVPGMSWGLGLAMGVFVGGAVASLRAIVAGTRVPHIDLRALGPALENGGAVLTVLVANTHRLAEVEAVLDASGAAELFTL